MDEHEVELIDYLRVLWWGKWLILTCLGLALGLSAGYSLSRPTTYSGSIELSLREYVTAAMSGDRGATTAVDAAVQTAMEAVRTEVPETTLHFSSGRIELSHAGATSADVVRGTLIRAEEALRQSIGPALGVQFAHLAVETRLQHDVLIAQREQLELLARDSLTTDALAHQIARLQMDLAAAQVRLRTLETVDPESLLVLTVSKPLETRAVRQTGRMLIAVAGFLGLMMGTLIAFFAHYLRQVQAHKPPSP